MRFWQENCLINLLSRHLIRLQLAFNMNCNEVIANRALKIIGKPKGSYEIINPNDHVNMSQSKATIPLLRPFIFL